MQGNDLQELKLVTVTRQDLTAGYQTVQSAHAIAEFAHTYPEEFKSWKEHSNSIITLSTKTLKDLEQLCSTLTKKNLQFCKFYEPDIDEVTSICIVPNELVKKVTSFLPLCNKNVGKIDKHHIPESILTREKVLESMQNTYQFTTQNVLQHGESVWKYYNFILDVLNGDAQHEHVLIPECISYHFDDIYQNAYGNDIIKEYCIMHDVGKPYCRTVDKEGKQHFPNHAQVSYDTYTQISDNKIVADLILHDMDIHLLKDDSFNKFIQLDKKQIFTHLFVGLSELLSNCQMFGGIESTSFKIKYKSYTKWAKRILKVVLS